MMRLQAGRKVEEGSNAIPTSRRTKVEGGGNQGGLIASR